MKSLPRGGQTNLAWRFRGVSQVSEQRGKERLKQGFSGFRTALIPQLKDRAIGVGGADGDVRGRTVGPIPPAWVLDLNAYQAVPAHSTHTNSWHSSRADRDRAAHDPSPSENDQVADDRAILSLLVASIDESDRLVAHEQHQLNPERLQPFRPPKAEPQTSPLRVILNVFLNNRSTSDPFTSPTPLSQQIREKHAALRV